MVIPVIHFSNGQCIEGIEFYKKAFDAEIEYITYPGDVPGSEIYEMEGTYRPVIHSQLSINGTKFNMSDSDRELVSSDMVCFNIFFTSEESMRKAFEILAEEGQVESDIEPQFWARLYAVVIDKFGVRWQMMFE